MESNLRKMTKEDLDMVLAWRNQDFVRTNMYNHKIIEKAEHYAWFEKINKDPTKIYLIYCENEEPLGLVAFTDIDIAEQSRAEQSRAEQSRAEQSRAEQSKYIK